jgi:hypothetical protein
MDFRRDSKTKFFKAGDEVKAPKFNPGDQVSVEASEDPGGYMTAVNVYWEKAAGGAPAKTDDGVVDTWKDDAPKAAGSERATDMKAPAPRDADDPGPPKLKRGGVADPTRQQAPPVPETAPEHAAGGRASGAARHGAAIGPSERDSRRQRRGYRPLRTEEGRTADPEGRRCGDGVYRDAAELRVRGGCYAVDEPELTGELPGD